MSDNGWITDRLPTKDDGEIVLIWCHDRWSDMHYSQVMNGAVWMRQPEPYQDPDGVGEGWRLLREGDERLPDDEYQLKQGQCSWWSKVNYQKQGELYTRHQIDTLRYRRRITGE